VKDARVFALMAVALVVGCGGDGPTELDDRPLDIGIISGNDQVANASKQQLTAPVVGRLVRLPSGKLAFRWTDAVLPRRAFAQTTVNGSPVPGAVVCAVSVTTERPLVPFVPCTNTDTAGLATFFFQTGTKAGQSQAEIRGTVANLPAVFDTARATVLPDSAKSIQLRLVDRDLGTLSVGDTIFLDREVTRATDKYGNEVTEWASHWVFSADSIVGTSYSGPAPAMPNEGRVAVVPAGARTFWFRVDGVTLWLKLRTP
jgi:hypothetical protein